MADEAPNAWLADGLREMLRLGGTDLHLAPDSPPRIRVHGRLQSLTALPLTAAETQDAVYSILHEARRQRFERERDLHCTFEVPGLARFRASLFHERGAVGAVFRAIPLTIPSLDALALPPAVRAFCDARRGLVLVAGPSGSGKSTTLASMVDAINADRALHIITLEDPIEHVHVNRASMIRQREIDVDTVSYVRGLRAALMEDADVVVVSDIADTDTADMVLRVAETGHLVLAALSATSAIDAVNRVVDLFPAAQQGQARSRLAMTLVGVLSQVLIGRADGSGKVAAADLIVPTPAVRNLVREDKIHQIYSLMQTGQKRSGMQTFNQSLCDLCRANLVDGDAALAVSPVPDELREMLMRAPGEIAPTLGPRPRA
jgi:twitching motility protein PilT